ncbi:MAG: DUF817 domain-containing protein [Robiginitomaculum sp.]|nr:DUF817 domain-containing protein [Robiginitomaculum sp.]
MKHNRLNFFQTLHIWAVGSQSKLHRLFYEILMFGIKQAWACLFGGLFLALIIASALFYPEQTIISRYDFLFFGAILIQIGLIAFKLETFAELKVIVIFHIIGTVMEIFKTEMGSWAYPEDSLIRLYQVPLFSGFMYSAVGSYIARAWRGFDFLFARHPPIWTALLLSAAIYMNFFSHHFIADIRIILFAITGMLFLRTQIYFKILDRYRSMPLILGFVLVAAFIWLAENISTMANIWLYPSQQSVWILVPLTKLGSWFLLMIISYGLIASLNKITKPEN